MLYHLLYPLRESEFIFNVVGYISFRAALALPALRRSRIPHRSDPIRGSVAQMR